GVSVAVTSSEKTVRSDTGGNFAMASLPSGTQQVDIRNPGFEPHRRSVELLPGTSTEIDVTLAKLTNPSTVDVRATGSATQDRNAFELSRASSTLAAIRGCQSFG
ncbi:MAG: carboxypeptidase regulatory-like domain-containing protein, partial [Phycisphaerae bacterium]|nr:carboxypeptidase regulatory-like domain-containing protein [Gemmatimonadaceae bacterium]